MLGFWVNALEDFILPVYVTYTNDHQLHESGTYRLNTTERNLISRGGGGHFENPLEMGTLVLLRKCPRLAENKIVCVHILGTMFVVDNIRSAITITMQRSW